MDQLSQYWSHGVLLANGLICLNLLGALGLGALLGYERSYHGRAAGIRTYALVCMASAILTVVCGYPDQWFGGGFRGAADPTRVIQGIVTGIGFLGAGVIMKEGFTIRGLSTSASIWTAAAVGVVVGIGFYAAALFATVLTILVMSAFRRLEAVLPHHQQMHLTLVFDRHKGMSAGDLRTTMASRGVEVMSLACQTTPDGGRFQYDLLLQTGSSQSFNALVDSVAGMEQVLQYQLTPSRE